LLFHNLTFIQGVQAAQEAHSTKSKSKCNRSASLKAVVEEQAPDPELPQTGHKHHQLEDSSEIQGLSDTLLNIADPRSRCIRTAKSENPLITVVHQSGIFDMDILYCICPNAGPLDEQLVQAGFLPSSFKQIETVFAFSVLDDFLTDNLECKTTAQQYYSKLQSTTNRMFPDNVPVS